MQRFVDCNEHGSPRMNYQVWQTQTCMHWKKVGKDGGVDKSSLNTCSLTFTLTFKEGPSCTHTHTVQVKLSVFNTSVTDRFIDSVKEVGFINYSNVVSWEWLRWRVHFLTLSLFFPRRMWLNPVLLSDNITLRRLPHTQAHTRSKIPPEDRLLVFYLWM